MNFNDKFISKITHNKTQRMHTESLGMSPQKKGVSLVPIRSKQNESPDSFDRENTGDDINADTIPDAKRKKYKKNIARDFNTNGRGPTMISKQLEFDEIEGDNDKSKSLLFIFSPKSFYQSSENHYSG